MTALLSLSPQMTLQSSLFQLSTMTDFSGVNDVLTDIQETLQAAEASARPAFCHQILNGTHDEIAQALVDIANNPPSLNALVSSERTVAVIQSAAKSHPIDTAHVRDGIQAWVDGPHPSLPGTPSWLSRLFGKMNYGLGNASIATLPLTLPALAGQLGCLLASGGVSPGWLAASAILVGTGMAASYQRKSIAVEMLDRAEKEPLSAAEIQAYFDHFLAVTPAVDAKKHDDLDVLDAIRKSSSNGGKPTLNRAATWRTAADFMNLAAVGTLSLQRDPSGQLYDRIAQAIGIGVLQRLQWQPIVLEPHRLIALQEMRRQGYKFIFVSNHRSHLDILGDVALLRDFSPRMIAKDGLASVPFLGWAPQHHLLRPSKWHRDGLLGGAKHPLTDRKPTKASHAALNVQSREVLENNHALFAYAEGTRMNTGDRGEEVGIQLFKNGVFHVAEHAGEKTVIVPVAHYGFGAMLPKSAGQAIVDGAMMYQPTVMSVGEPIEVSGRKYKELRLEAWMAVWRQLAAIQAHMNHEMQRP